MPRVNELLDQLRAQIRRTLDPLIPSGSSCALIDFPHHGNVGDSAIWLGEIAYLESRKCKIKYICDWNNYNQAALKAAIGKDLILLSGGGNFGDLYSHHQSIREQIVGDFPENMIVQLPQSIHFASEENLAHSVEALGAHRHLNLLLRDTNSLEFAERHFPALPRFLCPDMALMLDIKPMGRRKKNGATVVLSRGDNEKSVQFSAPSNLSLIVADWLEEPTPRMQWIYDWANRRIGWGRSKVSPALLNRLALMAANAMARQRLERGLDLLGRGEMIVTDRLHAIILGWLGGLDIAYVDNIYKKQSNFLRTWFPDCPQLVCFGDFESALKHVAKRR
jgi:pyruvyl transferase EpsO